MVAVSLKKIFFKQKTAYEISLGLVGSEMCIRDRDEALHGNLINVYAHSDFGRAFRSFHRDHLASVNKRTTVIVLGDARNNYNLPQEWVLKDVQQRAKQVIWLNPENRMTWGFGDSEMDRYAPYCSIVEECRNLNQLYRVIDRLVTV